MPKVIKTNEKIAGNKYGKVTAGSRRDRYYGIQLDDKTIIYQDYFLTQAGARLGLELHERGLSREQMDTLDCEELASRAYANATGGESSHVFLARVANEIAARLANETAEKTRQQRAAAKTPGEPMKAGTMKVEALLVPPRESQIQDRLAMQRELWAETTRNAAERLAGCIGPSADDIVWLASIVGQLGMQLNDYSELRGRLIECRQK